MPASDFIARLATTKATINREHAIDPYPYNTLDNLDLLDKLFAPTQLTFTEAASSGPILDLGCGDGDMGFYQSAQGHHVDMVDFEETNHNQMQMARHLSNALPGNHTVTSIDIDRGLHALDKHYSLTIAFGLLYHLKNPFLVLGDLALRSSFAAVSTRIIDSKLLPENLAAAYLVDNHELGADNTNFWLLNSKGFERLAKRCGWRVFSRVRFGNPKAGDMQNKDAREALLLASTYSVFDNIRLTYGINRVEFETYRWTQDKFGIHIEPSSHTHLEIRYYIPGPWLSTHTFAAASNGQSLPVELTLGKDECRARIPITKETTNIDITCKSESQPTNDQRPLGIILKLDPANPPLKLL